TDRFQSAAEVAEALAPHLPGSSASFAKIETSSRWQGSQLTLANRKPPRRFLPWALAATAAVVLLVTGAVALSGLFSPGGLFARRGDGPQPAPTQPGPSPAAEPGADDPNVLTVSQTEQGGGKYRSIGAALAAVQTGQTIRVLDSATYAESL